MNKQKRNAQLGSAFFYILLGVALFGALAFTVSRGMRSKSTSTITDRQADLMASDVIGYAQKVERGVSSLMQKRGMSEDQISFYNRFSTITDYQNGNCVDAQCQVFNAGGGGLNWQEPPKKASDHTWHFTNTHAIPGFDGTGNAGIVLHLYGVADELCRAINQHLGYDFEDIPSYSGSVSADSFEGSFVAGTQVTCNGLCENKSAACIEVEGAYSAEGENFGSEGNLFYYGIYVMPSDF